jgi:hypothetical protein
VVGFVDVVGYTNLTRHVTETELARLIERFESIAVSVVATSGGRVVKTLGDEVMFVADDAVGGSAIGLRLLDSIGADEQLPDVRIGMAWGHVLRRFGDVYGPVVNIASRLTSAAQPGTVLADGELATVLADEPTMGLRRRRPISVRGYNRPASWPLTWAVPSRAGPAAPGWPGASRRGRRPRLGVSVHYHRPVRRTRGCHRLRGRDDIGTESHSDARTLLDVVIRVGGCHRFTAGALVGPPEAEDLDKMEPSRAGCAPSAARRRRASDPTQADRGSARPGPTAIG